MIDETFFDEKELSEEDLSKVISTILDIIETGTDRTAILTKIGKVVQNIGFVD
jgi:hypothetical protein